MPKRSATVKADAKGKQAEPDEFPDELAINSDTSDDSDGQFNASDESDEEDDLETGLTGLDALIASARAQRGLVDGGIELADHIAVGAATAPVQQDAHLDSNDAGEQDEDTVVREGLYNDAVNGGIRLSGGDEENTDHQPARQGRSFLLSKRVPASSLLRDEAFMADDGSDSSEDERPPKNTVGDVPLEWYQHEEHIGYDREGQPIKRRGESKDMLDKLLLRNDTPGAALRSIYDPYNDEELVLSREELRTLLNIQKGRTPEVSVDPYADHEDWYSNTVDPFPVSTAPQPKRRFAPSMWEERKIVKLVRAIRRGWIKRPSERDAEEDKQAAEPVYLMWENDGNVGSHKTGAGLTRIAAPKLELPGNEESYNPPPEYLPTDAEKAAYAAMEEEDRPAFLPHAYGSLREVPAYTRFIHERFERSLDLYLCPRVRRKRMNVSKPDDLLPAAIPKPSTLKPYPNRLCITYEGHRSKIRSVCPDASGQWLLTGGDDGSLRLWEVLTARCQRVWELGAKVTSVGWCPDAATRVISCAAGNHVVLLDSGLGGSRGREHAAECLCPPSVEEQSVKVARWEAREGGGMQIVHNHQVRGVSWHGKGDYFVATCPGGASQSVVVHQLSKRSSQNPFRKSKGRVTHCAFHPCQPLLLVASETNIKVYHLLRQALTKTLLAGGGVITAMHIHPSGDHVLVGTEDKRCLWFDLDLSSKPYKVMKYHNAAVRAVGYHTRYPLFASSSDDGSVQVFHGMVYSDLMSNPLIVPVKTLAIHTVHDYAGVTSLAFHPSQPWVFTGGGDGKACLVVDV